MRKEDATPPPNSSLLPPISTAVPISKDDHVLNQMKEHMKKLFEEYRRIVSLRKKCGIVKPIASISIEDVRYTVLSRYLHQPQFLFRLLPKCKQSKVREPLGLKKCNTRLKIPKPLLPYETSKTYPFF